MRVRQRAQYTLLHLEQRVTLLRWQQAHALSGAWSRAPMDLPATYATRRSAHLGLSLLIMNGRPCHVAGWDGLVCAALLSAKNVCPGRA